MHTITTPDHEIISRQRLLAWINTHNCGVQPCGVLLHDGTIVIRVAHNDAKGRREIEYYNARTLAEARDVLGY